MDYRADIHFFYGASLLTSDVLDRWQELLCQFAPKWSRSVVRWRSYEKKHTMDMEDPGHVRRFFLAEAEQELENQLRNYERLKHKMNMLKPSAIKVGGDEFRGADHSMYWIVEFDDRSFSHVLHKLHFANWVTIQICSKRIERRPAHEWALDFFAAVCEETVPRLARAHMTDEYGAKNMDYEGGGARAIGLDLYRYLPGIYWLNHFGPPFAEFMGRDRLLSAPAFLTKEIGGGVTVQLHERPEMWDTPEGRETEARVLNHIDQRYFFSREDPDRTTVAPHLEVDSEPFDYEKFLQGQSSED